MLPTGEDRANGWLTSGCWRVGSRICLTVSNPGLNGRGKDGDVKTGSERIPKKAKGKRDVRGAVY